MGLILLSLKSLRKNKQGIFEFGFSVLIFAIYLTGLVMTNYEISKALDELIRETISI